MWTVYCVEKREIHSHISPKKYFVKSTTYLCIYLVISLVKPLLSRIFCQKGVRINFRNFHTVQFVFWLVWNFRQVEDHLLSKYSTVNRFHGKFFDHHQDFSPTLSSNLLKRFHVNFFKLTIRSVISKTQAMLN